MQSDKAAFKPSDKVTRENIKEMVANFYAKVREHRNLSPIFKKFIGKSETAWDEHIELIADFWATRIINDGGYEGRPLFKHIKMPHFPRERFTDWLALFESALSEAYTPQAAEPFLAMARGMAQRFQSVMYDGVRVEDLPPPQHKK